MKNGKYAFQPEKETERASEGERERDEKRPNHEFVRVFVNVNSIMVLSRFVCSLCMKRKLISMWPRGSAANRITGYSFPLSAFSLVYSYNEFGSQVNNKNKHSLKKKRWSAFSHTV